MGKPQNSYSSAQTVLFGFFFLLHLDHESAQSLFTGELGLPAKMPWRRQELSSPGQRTVCDRNGEQPAGVQSQENSRRFIQLPCVGALLAEEATGGWEELPTFSTRGS